MNPAQPTPETTARALTEYLTTPRPDRYGNRGGPSPLEAAIQAEITKLCNGMAALVVSANPDVVPVIRKRLELTVAAVLRDDRFLTDTLVTAFASAIQGYRDSYPAPDPDGS